jgi:hypothetical protein
MRWMVELDASLLPAIARRSGCIINVHQPPHFNPCLTQRSGSDKSLCHKFSMALAEETEAGVTVVTLCPDARAHAIGIRRVVAEALRQVDRQGGMAVLVHQ